LALSGSCTIFDSELLDRRPLCTMLRLVKAP
jgi:hypothetical protein